MSVYCRAKLGILMDFRWEIKTEVLQIFLPLGMASQSDTPNKIEPIRAREPEPNYSTAAQSGFIAETEDDRLIKDASRSGLEKLQLFTQMIRRNRILGEAKS